MKATIFLGLSTHTWWQQNRNSEDLFRRENKITHGDFFSFFLFSYSRLIIFSSVCQDATVGDMCLSKRFKLFYRAASDLKAFQTFSRDQILLYQTGILFQWGKS